MGILDSGQPGVLHPKDQDGYTGEGDYRDRMTAPPAAVTVQVSPMTQDAFDQFVLASDLGDIISCFHRLCDLVDLNPADEPRHFYRSLRSKLAGYWYAQSLFVRLDKRVSHKEYRRQSAASNMRALVIGAGPCGLRCAIEMALLGTKVVVLEKRERFSRNNVLHLWPFLITDLMGLGAKKFFGKFCAGSIDHISIRRLQCILLKVALLFGVQVFPGVSFDDLIEPTVIEVPGDTNGNGDAGTTRVRGWRAKLTPETHILSNYEFDVLIGADGKRNTLQGFRRKEFRGRLAIAITANFVNRHSPQEAEVEEISGVASIFNPKFFKDLATSTGIDLENLVYYKDETHYFVMTAKKASLLAKGVLKKDFDDPAQLLHPSNIDQENLQSYSIQAARVSTDYLLPDDMQFALNHYNQPDVALFDFTSLFAAENASRIVQRNGKRLLMSLVGDSLHEPFWPTGSGCARGFLSALDTAWMVRRLAQGNLHILEVIAERESIYQRLSQTTPQSMSKDFSKYTLLPNTRYTGLNVECIEPAGVRHLFDTDDASGAVMPPPRPPPTSSTHRSRHGRLSSGSHHHAHTGAPLSPLSPAVRPEECSGMTAHRYLQWLQIRLARYQDQVTVSDLSSSLRSGVALLCLIHAYRPDLVNLSSISAENSLENNSLAFSLFECEFGISPVISAEELEATETLDESIMGYYLEKIYEALKYAIPKREESSRRPRGHSNAGSGTPSDSVSVSRHFHHPAHLPGGGGDRLGRRSRRGFGNGGVEATWWVEEGNLVKRRDQLLNAWDEMAGVKSKRPNLGGPPSQLNPNLVSNISQMIFPSKEEQARAVEGLTHVPDKKTKPVAVPDAIAELLGQKKSEVCYFCERRVYIAERASAEGLYFHRDCLRCAHCRVHLLVTSYKCKRNDKGEAVFYCYGHADITEKEQKLKKSIPELRASLLKKAKAGDFTDGIPDQQRISTAAATASRICSREGGAKSVYNIPSDQPVPSEPPPPLSLHLLQHPNYITRRHRPHQEHQKHSSSHSQRPSAQMSHPPVSKPPPHQPDTRPRKRRPGCRHKASMPPTGPGFTGRRRSSGARLVPGPPVSLPTTSDDESTPCAAGRLVVDQPNGSNRRGSRARSLTNGKAESEAVEDDDDIDDVEMQRQLEKIHDEELEAYFGSSEEENNDVDISDTFMWMGSVHWPISHYQRALEKCTVIRRNRLPYTPSTPEDSASSSEHILFTSPTDSDSVDFLNSGSDLDNDGPILHHRRRLPIEGVVDIRSLASSQVCDVGGSPDIQDVHLTSSALFSSMSSTAPARAIQETRESSKEGSQGPGTGVTSPRASHNLAKMRFCMEAPKPVSIDPKEFIGQMNQKKVTAVDLEDFTAVLGEIEAVDAGIGEFGIAEGTIIITDVLASYTPSYDDCKVLSCLDYAKSKAAKISQNLSNTPVELTLDLPIKDESGINSELLPPPKSPGASPIVFGQISPTIPLITAPPVVFSGFADIRDIDSLSIDTENSSVTPSEESDLDESKNDVSEKSVPVSMRSPTSNTDLTGVLPYDDNDVIKQPRVESMGSSAYSSQPLQLPLSRDSSQPSFSQPVVVSSQEDVPAQLEDQDVSTDAPQVIKEQPNPTCVASKTEADADNLEEIVESGLAKPTLLETSPGTPPSHIAAEEEIADTLEVESSEEVQVKLSTEVRGTPDIPATEQPLVQPSTPLPTITVDAPTIPVPISKEATPAPSTPPDTDTNTTPNTLSLVLTPPRMRKSCSTNDVVRFTALYQQIVDLCPEREPVTTGDSASESDETSLSGSPARSHHRSRDLLANVGPGHRGSLGKQSPRGRGSLRRLSVGSKGPKPDNVSPLVGKTIHLNDSSTESLSDGNERTARQNEVLSNRLSTGSASFRHDRRLIQDRELASRELERRLADVQDQMRMLEDMGVQIEKRVRRASRNPRDEVDPGASDSVSPTDGGDGDQEVCLPQGSSTDSLPGEGSPEELCRRLVGLLAEKNQLVVEEAALTRQLKLLRVEERLEEIEGRCRSSMAIEEQYKSEEQKTLDAAIMAEYLDLTAQREALSTHNPTAQISEGQTEVQMISN